MEYLCNWLLYYYYYYFIYFQSQRESSLLSFLLFPLFFFFTRQGKHNFVLSFFSSPFDENECRKGEKRKVKLERRCFFRSCSWWIIGAARCSISTMTMAAIVWKRRKKAVDKHHCLFHHIDFFFFLQGARLPMDDSRLVWFASTVCRPECDRFSPFFSFIFSCFWLGVDVYCVCAFFFFWQYFRLFWGVFWTFLFLMVFLLVKAYVCISLSLFFFFVCHWRSLRPYVVFFLPSFFFFI